MMTCGMIASSENVMLEKITNRGMVVGGYNLAMTQGVSAEIAKPTVQRSVSFTRWSHQVVSDIAEMQGISFSEAIRQIVANHMRGGRGQACDLEIRRQLNQINLNADILKRKSPAGADEAKVIMAAVERIVKLLG
jgi:hypothetical protein